MVDQHSYIIHQKKKKKGTHEDGMKPVKTSSHEHLMLASKTEHLLYFIQLLCVINISII